MTRWEILEKTREVLEWKCIHYETYKQIRVIVDSIIELEDPISKEIENHKEEIRKLEEIRKKEEEWAGTTLWFQMKFLDWLEGIIRHETSN